MEKVSIAGGGPAGLACGIRLRQLGLAAEVYERQHYPLRKVCGEFLSPAGWARLELLGAVRHLKKSPSSLKQARFYYAPSDFFEFPLDPPAVGLSREAMDSALRDRFKELGGRVHEGKAAPASANVIATGRVLSKSGPWNAWKAYGKASALEGPGLTMVALEAGYCGLAEVESGRLSACLLWKGARRPEALLASHPVLKRLAPGLKPYLSIAGFDFQRRPGALRIGDASVAWPPVAGDGMSRALEEGMAMADALARGEKAPPLGNAFEFFLSKTMHSIMLSRYAGRFVGPLLKHGPFMASALYRFSRVP